MNSNPRYFRQVNLTGFGEQMQQKLHDARVIVIGAGGLGLPALQYLAAMGVGNIGIVDGDTIDISNLNRQILYTAEEIGLQKAEVSNKKLSLQNPEINISAYAVNLTENNAEELIAEYDVVVDATDNYAARYLINDVCVLLKKPFVYGAVFKFEGHFSVFNYNEGPTYRCLFPVEPAIQINCIDAGVLGVVPGIIGTYQAMEVIKIITGLGEVASGKLIVHNFLNNEQYSVKLSAKPGNKSILRVRDIDNNISASELMNWLSAGRNVELIDVREQEEYKTIRLSNSKSHPLSSLDITSIMIKNTLVIICQKGSRSQSAANLIKDAFPTADVYSLSGGIDGWQKVAGNKYLLHG